VRPQGPRTAAASRGRDPRFAGAIVGNSHVQILSPERLEAATQIPFVQLSVPATGPTEQLVLLEWFLRHHPGGSARAAVIGIDGHWCTGDAAMPNLHPFPFWLFGRSAWDYLRGLLRWSVLQELPRRAAFLGSAKAERARPDGYWDYEPEYARLESADPARLAAVRERRWPDQVPANGTGLYPAAERLAALLESLPADLAVVLIHPPIFAAGLSPPGTPRAEGEARCKAAFARAAAVHPGTTIVDWRVDRSETRDDRLFFDQGHYRQALARLVEADVVRALQATGDVRQQGAAKSREGRSD
jgi:hypothetical protein